MRTRCLSLALILLAAGCGHGGAAPAPPEPPPVNGGTLVYALPADPVSVTPLYGGDAAGLAIERNVFAGLVDADPSTLRTVPVIARSWSKTPDARTYTFRLRPHVSFPGGAGAVTAATFVADWSLLCSPSVASPNAAVLEPVSGYAACASGSGTLSGVRATGPLTLVVQLSRPVADFPSMLADPATWAFPPQLAATAGDRAAFEQAPVGAGPFRLVSLRKSTHPAGKAAVAGLAVLGRNRAYFGARPHLDRVEMPVVAGADAGSIAAYRAGRYQVLPLPPAEVDVVRADPEFGRQLLDTPRLSLVLLQRRPGATSPLAGGLSASQVTALAAGKSGQTADALVPVGMPGYVPNVADFAPSPVTGETVTLTRPAGLTERSYTKAVARVLRTEGAQVRIVRYGDWAVSELNLQSAAPATVIAALAGRGQTSLVSQVEAASPATVGRTLLHAQQTLLASGSIVPLTFGQTQLLIAPGVRGLVVDALGAPRLAGAWLTTGR
ncbi:MAG TPA: ABC transporter substrate-binding protein [Gaiellales bacterium]|nr:ABC transporter substrate-binding protein [Gaiellales bacterium]